MSSLAASTIYLKSEFTSADSGKVTRCLKSICKDVQETRKGRHWEVRFEKEDQASGFTIHVYKTNAEKHYSLFEDDLIELEIDSDQFPEVISIVSYIGREFDKVSCEKISNEISVLFDSVVREARLLS